MAEQISASLIVNVGGIVVLSADRPEADELAERIAKLGGFYTT